MEKLRIVLGSTLFAIGQVLSLIIASLLAITVGLFLSSVPRARFIANWAKFIRWWLKVCCRVDHQVIGLENLPETPSLILANHQSAWETIVFQTIFPPHSQVLKKELMFIPFFGWGLAANFPIAINRAKKTEALKQFLRQAKERFKSGRWILIFPEGTRQKPGTSGKYQAGGAYIAARTETDIVPVAHNAGLFWPKQSFLKKPGTIKVVIGKAIPAKGRNARELNQQVETWINQQLKALVD